jgi:hypothetical protein
MISAMSAWTDDGSSEPVVGTVGLLLDEHCAALVGAPLALQLFDAAFTAWLTSSCDGSVPIHAARVVRPARRRNVWGQ